MASRAKVARLAQQVQSGRYRVPSPAKLAEAMISVGEQRMALASEIQARRWQGETWKQICEALDLHVYEARLVLRDAQAAIYGRGCSRSHTRARVPSAQG